MSEYISVADTAKLVRAALKSSFPKVKFSVRSKSYSGGASINVTWTDGPTSDEVEGVVNIYEGATFDGSIDLKEYHSTLLAGADGQPREVRFGADFIFTHRKLSVGLLTKVVEKVCNEWGAALPEVKAYEYSGGAYVVVNDWNLERMIHAEARQTAGL